MKDEFVRLAMQDAGIGRKKAEYLWVAGFRYTAGLPPAEQHQGEPVALPIRQDPGPALHQWPQGWNACLDEIAKIGPLYTRPAQGEPVGWASQEFIDKLRSGQCNGIVIHDQQHDRFHTPLFTHADLGEVERLRAEIKHLKHTSVKEEVFDIVCKERDNLRAQLAERDALLRDIKRCGLDAFQVGGGQNIRERLGAALSARAEPSAES